MPDPLRIATLAHGHPALSAGGAEISAYALHRAFAAAPGIATLHISCLPAGAKHPSADLDEQFVETALIDSFRLARRDPREHDDLVAKLRSFRPDVIHLHHVLGFGVDVLFALRRAFPASAIVLTLHEYIAICHRQGQMLRIDGHLCERASPRDCAACFPDFAPGQFLLRERSLRAMFSLANHFIAPSAFLARRYAEWGLPADRISVLENVLPQRLVGPAETLTPTRRDRFAFFGQINPFKGIALLLRAIATIPADLWQGATCAIHGSGLERQPAEFRQTIADLLATTQGRTTWHGPYRNEDIAGLLGEADWVVVPSIWWENSPVVIQEAFRSGRPVITADIGGMAEKVHDGIDGLHFRAGDAESLAARLLDATDTKLWSRLAAGVQTPPAPGAIAAEHLALFRALLARGPANTRPVAASGG